MRPATLAQLRDWAAAGEARFSALGPETFLLFDAGRVAAAEARRLAAWLRALPCPTLAVGGGTLARAADVALDNAQDAEPLIEGIRRTPLAAAVFVQLLRATATLPVEDALVAESLAYATLQTGPEFRHWLATGRPAPPVIADAGPPVIVARTGNTLAIELNRASTRNALSMEVRDALNEALQLALADRTIRRVVLSGRGKCFSVGGELAEFGTAPDAATGHAIRGLALPARFVAQCAARVEVRLHGPCIGAGIEIPAFARRVVAAPRTSFRLPELGFGLIPGGGGCVSIPRRIGRQTTARLVLSGETIDAREALALGLVDAIAP